MNTAFLGLGAIGRPMATRIAGAGHSAHRVEPHRRSAPKPSPVSRAPGTRRRPPRRRATPTSSSPASRRRATSSRSSTGRTAFSPGLKRGATLVDCTSGDPATSRAIAARARRQGVGFLDAPVSGGVIGAEKGTLTVMVGGEAAALEHARPVIEAFSAEDRPLRAGRRRRRGEGREPGLPRDSPPVDRRRTGDAGEGRRRSQRSRSR